MPLNKKPPNLEQRYMDRFAKIPKAKWFDLYADLYRQTHDEFAPDGQVMDDAEQRLKILTETPPP